MSSGYRPPSSAPVGAWATHIHAKRRERGWSQTRGFEVAREHGLPLSDRSRSAYIAIDMGKRQPTAAELPALIATYGKPEPVPEYNDTGPAISEAGEIAAAIREQTAVIRELLDEIRGTRTSAVDQALREIRDFAARSGLPLQPDPPSEPGTASGSPPAAPVPAIGRP